MRKATRRNALFTAIGLTFALSLTLPSHAGTQIAAASTKAIANFNAAKTLCQKAVLTYQNAGSSTKAQQDKKSAYKTAADNACQQATTAQSQASAQLISDQSDAFSAIKDSYERDLASASSKLAAASSKLATATSKKDIAALTKEVAARTKDVQDAPTKRDALQVQVGTAYATASSNLKLWSAPKY
jgi:hypothetical protein